MISSTVDKIHEFMHTRARTHTHISGKSIELEMTLQGG